jgi:hypothetical protein
VIWQCGLTALAKRLYRQFCCQFIELRYQFGRERYSMPSVSATLRALLAR